MKRSIPFLVSFNGPTVLVIQNMFYPLENGLVCKWKHRQIKPVQSHPVQIALPSRPIPPECRIAERAYIWQMNVSKLL